MMDEKISEEVVKICKDKKIKISCAESITGGLVASTIISVAGASEVIEESYITYSDEVKHKVLGVKRATLEKFSAVSPQTIREMLEGLKGMTGADLLLASSGYAGPSGSQVGRVLFGIHFREKTSVFEDKFKGTRNQIREKACEFLLLKALEILKA